MRYIRKTQNPLTDVALLRLYMYFMTTQSAVSSFGAIALLCAKAAKLLFRELLKILE
ncbi:hypothetical protein [[Scytonema hofmanni] UTEX B 1581]|uniref:hypothetical protein n=1 Tax=[Scytonema hofmanni] UTEX B 1581 TaxID=379535 RepID=UPI0004B8A12F|nr:hypothetical protein [[Scytonema hofmanni] UTEX B 1581]